MDGRSELAYRDGGDEAMARWACPRARIGGNRKVASGGIIEVGTLVTILEGGVSD